MKRYIFKRYSDKLDIVPMITALDYSEIDCPTGYYLFSITKLNRK